MPARVNKQNIAVLHIGAFLNIFGSEKTYIIEHIAQIHDYTRSVTPLNGNLVNCFAFGHKVPRRIEVRSHVIRSLNILRINSMLRFALDVLHFKWRIKGPERAISIEVLG